MQGIGFGLGRVAVFTVILACDGFRRCNLPIWVVEAGSIDSGLRRNDGCGVGVGMMVVGVGVEMMVVGGRNDGCGGWTGFSAAGIGI